MIDRRGRTGRDRRRPDGTAILGAARRLAYRHRRALAGVLAFAAVLATVSAVRPAPEPTRGVVVAGRDVPAGGRLTAADLATVTMPARWAPPGALATAASAEGRVALGPVAAGEPLTPARLVGGDRTAGESPAPALPAGLVAAPVRVADAGAAALVSAGDTVDVVAAREADAGPQAQVVAREVRVLAVPRRGSGSGGGGLLAAGATETGGAAAGSLLVLAVTPPTALALARAAVSDRLSLVLHVG